MSRQSGRYAFTIKPKSNLGSFKRPTLRIDFQLRRGDNSELGLDGTHDQLRLRCQAIFPQADIRFVKRSDSNAFLMCQTEVDSIDCFIEKMQEFYREFTWYFEASHDPLGGVLKELFECKMINVSQLLEFTTRLRSPIAALTLANAYATSRPDCVMRWLMMANQYRPDPTCPPSEAFKESTQLILLGLNKLVIERLCDVDKSNSWILQLALRCHNIQTMEISKWSTPSDLSAMCVANSLAASKTIRHVIYRNMDRRGDRRLILRSVDLMWLNMAMTQSTSIARIDLIYQHRVGVSNQATEQLLQTIRNNKSSSFEELRLNGGQGEQEKLLLRRCFSFWRQRVTESQQDYDQWMEAMARQSRYIP